MTLSLTWLTDYLKLALTPDEISAALTSIGLEVEKMETHDSVPGGLLGVVAGKVLTCDKHPDADRLSVTTVNVGSDKTHHIVCGANNIAAGQTVWVALPGTTLCDATGKSWTISVSKIRGQLSEGMICAEDELGLGTNHDGIMVLPDEVVAGTSARNYYNVTSDTIFEIGLTPNRSDATSILGVAQDLAAYLGVQENIFYPVQYPPIPAMDRAGDGIDFKLDIRNTKACPRYSGVIISDLKIGPAPDWMQQRLQAIGVKSINNVVDITNFVLHEMGQPLHAFDADKIRGNGIIVETKPAGTPFLALDDETYKLNEEDLIICDAQGNPMCIAGVYGGLNSGVSDTTTTIFLESAHFNAGFVRRTSMRHNLRTEAAKRFEKGSDPLITVNALGRAVDLLKTYAGGKVSSPAFDIYPDPVVPVQVSLSLKSINEKTGVTFSVERIEKIFEALSMAFTREQGDSWTVSVPTNKPDVTRDVDVIEEILRIHGFVHVELPAKMHTSVAIEPKGTPHRFRNLIGDHLAAQGFLECMNMSLTQPAYYRDLKWTNESTWVTIHNTSNESLNLMRPEMIIPMLETIRRNINRKQDDLRLFEFGKSYGQYNGDPFENEHLVLAITGEYSSSSWLQPNPRALDYFALKESVMGLLRRVGIHKVEATAIGQEKGFEFGIEITAGGVSILRMGCVRADFSHYFDIRQPVFVADIDFQHLINLSNRSQVIYEELNRFPAVLRDLAVILDQQVSFDQISEVVHDAGTPWLTNVEVFDLYRNEDHVGIGKMSIALRFTIENKEATLSDKDIDQWFSKVQKALEQRLGAAIRKG